MESCCNRNANNGRGYRNPMNVNYRSGMNSSCNSMPKRDNNSCTDMSKMPGRSAGAHCEIECVCRPKKNCHRNDPMEQLGNNFPVVMSYVPWQQWGELYDTDCALMQGTLFKDLNYIFCGVRC